MDSKLALKFDVPLGNVRMLKSGSLTCLYEHGKLRYIRSNGTEILRMIYTAVRDADWNTAPYHIMNESVVQQTNGFEIIYTADYRMNDISYKADLMIQAHGDELLFSMNGEAMSDFKRNRIGICVLHNVKAIAQKEVTVTRPDGGTYVKTFPVIISPHQPIKDITRLAWSAGVAVLEIKFEGDVFETEDQRNWTDSSFKTYSTPLDLPMPVNVKKGDRVDQRISMTVTASADSPEISSASSGPLQLPFPRVGVSKTPGVKLSSQQVDHLKEIFIDHYRVELDFASEKWKHEFEVASGEATQLKLKLQLTCFFNEDAAIDLEAFFQTLPGKDHQVESILVLNKAGGKSGKSYPEIHARIKQQFPFIKVGYGTNSHFADLNRNLPSGVPYDFVSFGVTPQAHSTDTISLLENLDNQQDILNTIREHLGDTEVHVSPLTFKGRKPTLFAEGDEPADFDERQHTEFGAAWVMKALRNFSGVSVTLFDATGYKGIVTEEHAHGGFASPLYNIFKTLKDFQPTHFFESKEAEDLLIEIGNGRGERFSISLDPKFREYREFKQQQ